MNEVGKQVGKSQQAAVMALCQACKGKHAAVEQSPRARLTSSATQRRSVVHVS